MNEVYTFEIRVAQDEDVCIATMVSPGFENIQGSSKRHPKDTFHHTIGECVAFERLFENLAEHYGHIVQALQNPPESVEENAEINIAEAAWLQQFGVPLKEMGVVVEPNPQGAPDSA